MAIICCRNCKPPKRHPGCHDHCEQYQKEKAEWDAEQAAIRKAKDIEAGLDQTLIKGIYKRRPKGGKRRGKPWER